jgi:hypothetical protein
MNRDFDRLRRLATLLEECGDRRIDRRPARAAAKRLSRNFRNVPDGRIVLT